MAAYNQNHPSAASAEDDSVELAKKLSNPIASLISVPFQFNWDQGYGPDEAYPADSG